MGGLTYSSVGKNPAILVAAQILAHAAPAPASVPIVIKWQGGVPQKVFILDSFAGEQEFKPDGSSFVRRVNPSSRADTALDVRLRYDDQDGDARVRIMIRRGWPAGQPITLTVRRRVSLSCNQTFIKRVIGSQADHYEALANMILAEHLYGIGDEHNQCRGEQRDLLVRARYERNREATGLQYLAMIPDFEEDYRRMVKGAASGGRNQAVPEVALSLIPAKSGAVQAVTVNQRKEGAPLPKPPLAPLSALKPQDAAKTRRQ